MNMDDEKRYTEREVIQRERKAYENGLVRGSACEFTEGRNGGMGGLLADVEKAYPMPCRCSRAVQDPHVGDLHWRVMAEDGSPPTFQVRAPNFEWRRAAHVSASWTEPTPERVALWADLLARRFEESPGPGWTFVEDSPFPCWVAPGWKARVGR